MSRNGTVSRAEQLQLSGGFELSNGLLRSWGSCGANDEDVWHLWLAKQATISLFHQAGLLGKYCST